MITPTLIYWANICTPLKATIMTFILIFIAILIISYIIFSNSFLDLDEKQIKSLIKGALGIILIIVLLAVINIFIPSTRTVYEMYIVPKLANSDLARNMPIYIQKYIEKEIKNE